MLQFCKPMEATVANNSGVPEADTGSKNGRISRSQTSRVTFRLSRVAGMITIVIMCLLGAVNAQTEPNIPTKDIPLIIVDGEEGGGVKFISPGSIESITILKDRLAIDKYGEKGKNGAIIVATKLDQSRKNNTLMVLIENESPHYPYGIGLPSKRIESITVLKDQLVIEQYGKRKNVTINM